MSFRKHVLFFELTARFGDIQRRNLRRRARKMFYEAGVPFCVREDGIIELAIEWTFGRRLGMHFCRPPVRITRANGAAIGRPLMLSARV